MEPPYATVSVGWDTAKGPKSATVTVTTDGGIDLDSVINAVMLGFLADESQVYYVESGAITEKVTRVKAVPDPERPPRVVPGKGGGLVKLPVKRPQVGDLLNVKPIL